MLKTMPFFFVLMAWCGRITAQEPLTEHKSKSPIDSAAINHWTSLDPDPSISANGQYFLYTIRNRPFQSNTLVVQSTTGEWKAEFPNASKGFFSSDSKRLFFLRSDTVFLFAMRGQLIAYVNKVVELTFVAGNRGEWLAMRLKNEQSELLMYNVESGKERRFGFVDDFQVDSSGDVLLLRTGDQQRPDGAKSLVYVRLAENETKIIWSAPDNSETFPRVNAYALDGTAKQACFVIEDSLPGKNSCQAGSHFMLWYFNRGMDKAALKTSDNSRLPGNNWYVANYSPYFSDDGRYIYFRLYQPLPVRAANDPVSLDVWSFQDTVLKSVQIAELREPSRDVAVSVDKDRVVLLTMEDESISAFQSRGDFTVITKSDLGDRFWLSDSMKRRLVTYWVVSLKDGTRRQLYLEGMVDFYFSPDGRFLLYYASNRGRDYYYAYDLASGTTRNICDGIPAAAFGFRDEYIRGRKAGIADYPVDIGGWCPEDTSILVYDNYDVWELFYESPKSAVNLTNNYGRLHHRKFRLTYGSNRRSIIVLFHRSDSLLLTAYNTVNKFNGFYTLEIGKLKDPGMLIMGPWKFDHAGNYLGPPNYLESDQGMDPIKAKHAHLWILQRQNAMEAPNYFATSDFKHLNPLTFLQPEKSVNWLTAELISWRQLDGTYTQGILYKPEDFDPNKKYPVIFNYYSQMTQLLYEYRVPDYMHTTIDVAWFVSRGYIVCLPDIHFTVGFLGRSVLNAVESGARYLSQFRWIDKAKMAVEGHSLGGFETNYVITHSHFFAAAIEGAGVVNMVSAYLGVSSYGAKRLELTEAQLGGTLWSNGQQFIENSPVLLADHVTTPLLINHSKADYAVPWEQGAGMFLALRRLNKPVWMLQYDGQAHYNDGEPAVDLTIRATQFLDHYLKNGPTPVWMSRGIPAKLKGIDRGYETAEQQ